MENIANKIFKRIKQAHIKPKPRWQFLLRSAIIWGTVVILIIIASIASSAIIFDLQNTDWMIRRRLGWSWGQFIFMNLPYFWIVLLMLFGAVAYYSFKQTKSGYKYTMPIVLLLIIFLSIGTGWLAHHSFRGGRWIEQRANRHMPFFQRMTSHRQTMWLRPDKGLIAGTIISDVMDNKFELQSLRGEIWTIKVNSTTTLPDLQPQKNDKVKIIGERIDGQNFSAQEIKPFLGPGPDMRMPGGKNIPLPPPPSRLRF